MYRLFAEEDPYMRLARKIYRGRSIYEILKKKKTMPPLKVYCRQ